MLLVAQCLHPWLFQLLYQHLRWFWDAFLDATCNHGFELCVLYSVCFSLRNSGFVPLHQESGSLLWSVWGFFMHASPLSKAMISTFKKYITPSFGPKFEGPSSEFHSGPSALNVMDSSPFVLWPSIRDLLISSILISPMNLKLYMTIHQDGGHFFSWSIWEWP